MREKKIREAEYNAPSSTQIPQHVLIIEDSFSPLTMIFHYSVYLGDINTMCGNWENVFLKPKIITHPESTNSYGSAP